MQSEQEIRGRKPLGGFAFITVPQICAVWTAYRRNQITLFDLRTWFACWEMTSRRCVLAPKRLAHYSFAEAASLTGTTSEKRARDSIRRLERASLLSWSDSLLAFPVGASTDAEAMLQQIANNRRKIPVPRRMLRFMAMDAGRILIATLIGHLLRCMYYRNGECRAQGLCKSSWIAEVFQVDSRNVKSARKSLARLGVLFLNETAQWKLNRFGMSATINLAWGTSGALEKSDAESPPPSPHSDPSLPPPESNRELLSKYKNQKPTPSRQAGFVGKESGSKRREAPRLERIELADLSSLARLRVLFSQAVGKKLLMNSESSWLSFVAASEHARRAATMNPCGLFCAILTRGLWKNISQDAENAAIEKLKRAGRGDTSRPYQPSRKARNAIPARVHEPRITAVVEQLLTSIRSGSGSNGSCTKDASSIRQATPAMSRANKNRGVDNIADVLRHMGRVSPPDTARKQPTRLCPAT